ncbi:MAG TPA: helix-turn-helix domain-containing protein [Thermoanaerobaculia bacterium]|jgi:AcrR family transcriptional regulator
MGRRPRVDRQEVLAAAREVFGARGFDGATLAAIAAKVGLSPAALLRHAPTKQELFEAAFAGDRGEIRLPIEFLAGVDAAAADPAKVLRRVAEALVPFLERIVGETVALWLRSNALAVEDPGRLPLLFDRARRPTPPQRALVLIENYLRRAARARRLRVKDPRAAAIGLLGALHSYVLLHRVARAIDPPLALGRYLDTVIDVWLAGLAARGPKERS